jgi:hypothetical protein
LIGGVELRGDLFGGNVHVLAALGVQWARLLGRKSRDAGQCSGSSSNEKAAIRPPFQQSVQGIPAQTIQLPRQRGAAHQ